LAKAQELVRLATMAARSRGVSLAEIEAEFGGSHRTAQRWTEALMAAFPATERRLDEEGKARWVLPARAVAHFLTPSAEELAALGAALQELGREGMTAEAALVRQLEAKVKALIPPRTALRLAVDEEALLEALGHAARPGPRPVSRLDVDAAISGALKGPFLLKIVYRSRDDPLPRERVVAPHGLLLGVRRYLVARDTAKSGKRLLHYRVEEISEAEVLGQSFELNANFNITEHAQKAFGSYENPSEFGEVVWKFTPAAAPHARLYQFHPTQQLEPQDDGSLVVRFHASGFLEMCWHLYAWGDAVEVLAPDTLRGMVHDFRRDDFPALP
jgi:predicted DNA-binding transcriptional regulator YafY